MHSHISVEIIKDEFKREILENKRENFKISPINGQEMLDILKNFNEYKLNPNYIVSTYEHKKNKVFMLFSGEEVVFKIKDIEYHFKYEDISKVEYSISDRLLKIYKESESVDFKEGAVGEEFPFFMVSEILRKIISEETIKISLNQNPSVKNLSNKSKSLYLKILISFLKSDDGIIDDKEYRELCSVMANMKIDEEISDELREYRYSDVKENTEYDFLVNELQESLIFNDKVEPKEIFQSLALDIVNMHKKEVLDKWRDIQHLVDVFKAIDISDKQVETLILVREKQIKALTERLDNKSLSDLQREISSILGAVGLSYVGVGVMALFFATGIGTILGIGYVGYKITKKILGIENTEKYALQNDLLKAKIESLSATNAYIVADMNYLNNKNKEIIGKLAANRDYNETLISELKNLLDISDVVSKSSMIVVEDQKHFNVEILLRKLPESIDIELYDKLAMNSMNYYEYNEIIYSVYEPDLNSETGEYIISQDKDVNLLEEAYIILKEIDYFDSGVKKGISTLKSFLKK